MEQSTNEIKLVTKPKNRALFARNRAKRYKKGLTT